MVIDAPDMYLWIRKCPLNYGSRPHLDQVKLGFFLRVLNIPRWGIFHSLAHIGGKAD